MSNPTTPFSWQMPTATDLVTDLPADFEVFGQAVATSMADLLGGTTGQVLSKTTNADMDFTWINNDQGDITGVTAGTGISGGGTSGTVTVTNSMATAIDAKGDLIAGTGADAFARLAVGTNGQVLTADSTAATGLAWSASSSGGWTSLGSGSLSSNILTISSISSAYKDLRLIIKNVQVASAADVIVNANSSTNIDYLQVRAANTTVTNDAVTATANWYLNNNQLNTGSIENIVVLEFPNYAETSGYKIVNSRSRFFANSQSQQMIAGATVLTASAISEIVIKTGGANFAGGTYEIWGIK